MLPSDRFKSTVRPVEKSLRCCVADIFKGDTHTHPGMLIESEAFFDVIVVCKDEFSVVCGVSFSLSL